MSVRKCILLLWSFCFQFFKVQAGMREDVLVVMPMVCATVKYEESACTRSSPDKSRRSILKQHGNLGNVRSCRVVINCKRYESAWTEFCLVYSPPSSPSFFRPRPHPPPSLYEQSQLTCSPHHVSNSHPFSTPNRTIPTPALHSYPKNPRPLRPAQRFNLSDTLHHRLYRDMVCQFRVCFSIERYSDASAEYLEWVQSCGVVFVPRLGL